MIQIGQVYKHSNNIEYVVIDNDGRMQTDVGEWVRSVIYTTARIESHVYTRSYEEFKRKFEPTDMIICDKNFPILVNMSVIDSTIEQIEQIENFSTEKAGVKSKFEINNIDMLSIASIAFGVVHNFIGRMSTKYVPAIKLYRESKKNKVR